MDEPVLDVVIGVATIVCGAGTGTLIRVAAARVGLPQPDLSGGFAAVVVTALVLPGGLWVRRQFLRHRYGRGTLTAADLAEITANLHTSSDARELLGKAATTVAAASGQRQVGLVLGAEPPDMPACWMLFALVGAARSVAEALAVDVEPDVALLDLKLPDGDGIGLGAALKRRWPTLRVVVFTMHADDQSVVRSLGTGLDGYLLKDSDPDDVLAAIHAAARGSMVIGRGAQAAIVAAASAAPQPGVLAVLDSRDLEILELLARGSTTSQAAARLFLAPKTIRNRVSEMLGKLGVATRDEAVALYRAAHP